MANNNPTPAGYSVQFGYGVQPESKATEYIDSKGVRLNHTFTEINDLFGSSGDSLIGTNRTGSIASGDTLGQTLDSITQAILNDRGFAADLEYWFQNNTKGIVGMEKNEDALWVAGGAAVLTHDTSLWKIGYQTLELAEADNVGGTNYATIALKTPLDLTKFNSLFASSVDTDFIRLAFYVSDPTKVNISPGAGISILISDDPTCATNRKRIDIKTLPAAADWVYVDAPKSAFTDDTGVADWANIQSVRVAWASTNNAAGAYVAFDDLWLCRQDPIEYVPNPFQRKQNGVFTRDFTIKDGFWYVGDQSIAGFLQAININPGVDGYGTVPAALAGQIEYTDFTAQMIVFIETGTGGYSNSIVWEISDTERVAVFLNNNNLILNVKLDTLDTSYSTPFVTFVGNLIELKLEKIGTTVIASVKQTNDFDIATVRAEVNTTKAGVLSIGNLATWTPILTIGITTTRYSEIAGKAYIIGNTPWFSVVARDNASYNYYINPTSGSDLNNGLSAGAAFRTIQRFLLEPFAYTYIRNGIMNVYLAAGTYGETITMPPVIGSGTMNWIGVTAASVFIDKISCHSTYLYTTFQGISLTATGTSIYLDGVNKMYFNVVWATAASTTANYGAQVFYSNAHFDTCQFSNKTAAMKGHFPGTHVLVQNCTGTGNTYSLYVEYGAIGHNIGTMPGSTTSSFAASGSMIIL